MWDSVGEYVGVWVRVSTGVCAHMLNYLMQICFTCGSCVVAAPWTELMEVEDLFRSGLVAIEVFCFD